MRITPAVRLGIVEFEPIVRRGARAALEEHPRIEVVSTTSDVGEAVRLARRSDLDLLLVDVEHPQFEVEELLALGPAMRVVLTAKADRGAHIEQRGGHLVLGFVSKQLSPERFRDQVFEAATGTGGEEVARARGASPARNGHSATT